MLRLIRPFPLLLGLARLISLAALPLGHGQANVAAQPANIQLTTVQGKTLKLASFRGKWVLVNLWAPWCPICYREVPALNELDARPDVVVIGVAVDYGTDEASVRQAIERAGMRYQAHVLGGNRTDADNQSRRIGPTLFYPTTYVYSPDGRQHQVIVGPVSTKQIQELMASYPAKGRPAGLETPWPPYKGF
jgi:thiol-disulfide isomerase/thioredoxin